MAKKKKKKHPAAPEVEGEEPVVLPKVPEKLARPFEAALKNLKPAPKKEPERKPTVVSRPAAPIKVPPVPAARDDAPPKYSYEDRVALRNAYAGVRREGGDKPTRPRAVPPTPPDPKLAIEAHAAEERAREKLAQLVAGGLRFDVSRDRDGFVEGVRTGVGPGPLRELKGGRAAPDAQLDLHRMRTHEAEAALVRFLRTRRRERDRVVLVVHGKGTHSEGGVGVLASHVVTLLTEGDAAPHVLAFSSVPDASGGTGAMLVRLAS